MGHSTARANITRFSVGVLPILNHPTSYDIIHHDHARFYREKPCSIDNDHRVSSIQLTINCLDDVYAPNVYTKRQVDGFLVNKASTTSVDNSVSSKVDSNCVWL